MGDQTLTPDSFMAKQTNAGATSLTPDSYMAKQGSADPSLPTIETPKLLAQPPALASATADPNNDWMQKAADAVEGGVTNLGVGIAKGGLRTLNEAAKLATFQRGAAQNPDSIGAKMDKASVPDPNSPMQKIGFGGEQIGEYFAAPEEGIEKGIAKVAPKIPKLISKVLASGVTGAGVSTLHGEDPVKGGIEAAAGRGLGEGVAKPIADKIASFLPQRMMNWLLRTSPKGYNYGRNPGQGVVDQGTTAWSKEGLLEKLNETLSSTGKQIEAHLSNPAVDKPVIDLTKAIKEPIVKAQNYAMAGGNQTLYRQLEDLENGLTMSFGPQNRPNWTGVGNTPTKLMPNALLGLTDFTPGQANKMKQFVGESARWTGDSAFDQLSPVKKAIYGKINDEIEKAAPGIKALNRIYGEHLDASQSLDHAIRLGRKYNPYGSVQDLAALFAGGGPGYVASKVAKTTPFVTGAANVVSKVGGAPEPIRKAVTGALLSSSPDNASHVVLNPDGDRIGHIVNGKYVPLQQGDEQ